MATSDDASDDELASLASSHGLAVFRGPLNDVLGRYCLASSNLADNDVVIRLTADNLVPDGQFVEQLVEAFASAKKEYVGTDSSRLPYGVGAEAFSVAALRRAQREATSAEDREHVTPWIRRNCSSTVCSSPNVDNADLSFLRATIDDKEDYQRILRLFEQIPDPINVPWRELVHILARLPGEPKFRVPYRLVAGRPHSKLTLGTVQLGMPYGAVNDSGQPSAEEAITMVRTAIAHGVTTIDTARAYGTAEEVVGKALRGAWASRCTVVTKLDLSEVPADAAASRVRAEVDAGISASCGALGSTRLTVLLLHRWRDHDSWNGAAWQRLLELRDSGKIGTLGASVYDPAEALEALQDAAVGHLQLPVNLLDWRWETTGIDRALAARPDVVVHTRSALLQGLLVHSANRWPEIDGLDASGWPQSLRQIAGRLGRESVIDLCLAYVRSLPWVTSVVVGCETMKQLEENLRLFRTPDLRPEQIEEVRQEIPRAPEALLNPSKWKRLHESPTTR